MKKILLPIISICAFSLSVFAQDAVQKAAADAAAELSQAPQEEAAQPKPNYWTSSIQFNLGYNMTNLSNWAAGGYNTITLTTNLDAKADYAKDLMSWNNRLQLDYGFLYSNEKENILQKSNDRIYFESKWAYQTSSGSKFNYTASFNFRSQFTDTPDKYSQDEDGKWFEDGIKSGFISPAYTDIALGIQWKPTNWFDLNFAPLTGGFTICTNDALRASYGMKPLSSDETKYHAALFQFGAQLKANLKVSINENFSYETQGVIFTDYLNEPYFRINWDNAINWQLSKYVKFAFKTWLIYDPLVTISETLEDGTVATKKRGVQFKDFLSFSFTYTIASKK